MRAEPATLRFDPIDPPGQLMIERRRSHDKDSMFDRSFHLDTDEVPHLDHGEVPFPETPSRQEFEPLLLSHNPSEVFPGRRDDAFQMPIKFGDSRPLFGFRPETPMLSILPKMPEGLSPIRPTRLEESEHSDTELANQK